MTAAIEALLRRVGALDPRSRTSRVAPTEDLVAAFERRFALALPPDYRAVLLAFGGMYVDLVAPFDEPTPVGTEVVVEELFGFSGDETSSGDIRGATLLSNGAPTVVPIATNLMDQWTYLVCSGPKTGSVLFHDLEQRASWSDERFHERFPNLAPSIESYLALRRKGSLPAPAFPKAPSFYRVAPSFTSFIERCRPRDE